MVLGQRFPGTVSPEGDSASRIGKKPSKLCIKDMYESSVVKSMWSMWLHRVMVDTGDRKLGGVIERNCLQALAMKKVGLEENSFGKCYVICELPVSPANLSGRQILGGTNLLVTPVYLHFYAIYSIIEL